MTEGDMGFSNKATRQLSVGCLLLAIVVLHSTWCRAAEPSAQDELRRAVRSDVAVRNQVLDQITARGEAVVSSLFLVLEQGSTREARLAAEVLGRVRGEQVRVQARVRFLELQVDATAANAFLRELLLRVYARSAEMDGVPTLVEALEDERLRAAAEEELTRVGSQAIEPLIIAVARRTIPAQEAAIRVLRTMSPFVAPIVVSLFHREDERVSRFAGMLLGELQDPAIVPELVRLVEERDAFDESDVMRALSVYDDPEARRAVMAAFDSPFPYLRFAAVEGVREWGDEAGEAMARDGLLRLAVTDPSPEVREGALRSLLALWSEDSVPIIESLLEDSDTPLEVFEAAAQAFGFLAGFPERDTLVQLYADGKRPRSREAMGRALLRMTYQSETAGPHRWREEAPAWVAREDRVELEALRGGPEELLSAWSEGRAGPILLVFSGLPDYQHDALAPWLRVLADDYQLVAVDLPALPESPARVARWEERLDRSLERLRVRLGVPVVTAVGHGVGGLLAARYAARHPDRVDKLVIIGVPGFDHGAFRDWRASMLRRQTSQDVRDLELLGAGARVSVPRSRVEGAWRVVVPVLFANRQDAVSLRGDRGFADLGAALVTALSPFDSRSELLALQVPTLWLQGSADYTDASTLAAWKERSGPMASVSRHMSIDGAGHFPFIERPKAFADALVGWLPACPR